MRSDHKMAEAYVDVDRVAYKFHLRLRCDNRLPYTTSTSEKLPQRHGGLETYCLTSSSGQMHLKLLLVSLYCFELSYNFYLHPKIKYLYENEIFLKRT